MSTSYTVASGQTSTGLTLSPGDQMSVQSGGSSIANTIDDNAIITVASGGSDTGTQVASGGTEQFAVGATVSNLSLAAGATFAEIGLTLSGFSVSMTVEALAADVVVNSVGAGGTTLDVVAATATTVGSGAILFVSSGGSTTGSTVSAGGFEIITSGGAANGSTINGGAEQLVEAGVARGTFIDGNGALEELLSAGTTATGSLIVNGGQETVSRGATTVGDNVGNGGAELVYSGGTASQTSVGIGGQLVINSAGTAADTVISGGTLVVGSGGNATGGITFATPGGTLAVIQPTATPGQNAVAATLSGLAAGDSIDLSGITYVAGAHAGIVGDVLTVTDGGQSYSFQLDAAENYDGLSFTLSASTDPFTSGTDLTVQCFGPGTRIATPDGTRAVETLRPGDRVLTADGGSAAIRWLGVQTVPTGFADPLRVLPVRVLAGALADNVPGSDLVLSPGHALLLDGMLVQAGALVNGLSILRETQVPTGFCYYHVELPAHAVILAEGAPCESFLDGVEPMAFDNAAERAGRTTAGELAYPRVKAQRQLPAATRARIAARAALLAPATDLAA